MKSPAACERIMRMWDDAGLARPERGDEEAWCAVAVSAWLKRAGLGGTVAAGVVIASTWLPILAPFAAAITAAASTVWKILTAAFVWSWKQVVASPVWTAALVGLIVLAVFWSGSIGYDRGDAQGYAQGYARGVAVGARALEACHGNVGRRYSWRGHRFRA